MAGENTDQSQAGVSSGPMPLSVRCGEVFCPWPQLIVTCTHWRLQDLLGATGALFLHSCLSLGSLSYTFELPWPLRPCLSFSSLESTCNWVTCRLSQRSPLHTACCPVCGQCRFPRSPGFYWSSAGEEVQLLLLSPVASCLYTSSGVGSLRHSPRVGLAFSLVLCNRIS